MRKYSAIFALILTLWGIFSPFGISMTLNPQTGSSANSSSVISVKTASNVVYARGASGGGTSNPSTPPAPADDTPPTDEETKPDDKNALDCSFYDIYCGMYKVIITFILFIPNALTVIAGLLMDFSLYISINPGVYGVGGDSVETGLRMAWSVIRDFANIGFIFALFVIAFSLILNKNLLNFDPKKGIVKVIIMALLVNFSFLMCRFIIQGADIFSHFLYNKITVEDPKTNSGLGGLSFSNLLSSVGVKTPSLQIISHVGPQQAFVKLEVDSASTDSKFTLGSALIGTAKTIVMGPGGLVVDALSEAGIIDVKGPDFYIQYGIMAVVSFFIYLILIFTFISVAFIFLGRIFGLWLGMVISPLAFVSYAIPMLEDNKFIGFNNWLKSFIELAFVTPIFIFFMYLTVVVFNMNSIIPTQLGGTGIIPTLLRELIPAIGATFLLLKGKKIATDLAGEVGVIAGKLSGAVSTLALGAVTGGTAMIGRQTLGRAGAAIANSQTLRNAEAGGSRIAAFARSAGSKTSATSFDIRNSKLAMDGFGKFTGATGNKIDLGSQYQQDIKDGSGYKKEGSIENKYYDYKKEIEEKKKKEAEEKAKGLLLGEEAETTQKLRLAEKKLRDKEEDMTEEAKYAVDEAGIKETKAKEKAEATTEFDALTKAKEGQESHEKETKAEKTLLEKDIAAKEKEFTDSIADLTDQIKESKKGLFDTDNELKATNLSLATATGDKKKELESKKQDLESKKQVLSNQVTTLENTKQTKKSSFENNNPDLATKRDRLTTINTERTAKQKSVTDAKTAYENTEEFKKLKIAKDEKKQKEADLNQIKKDVKNTDEFKTVDAIKKKIETTNKAVLETYAKTLDNVTKTNATILNNPRMGINISQNTGHNIAGVVGVLTGGNVMGRSVLQGGKRSASAVRSIARTDSGPKKPPSNTK